MIQLPGDVLTAIPTLSSDQICKMRIGLGMMQSDSRILATRAGFLHCHKNRVALENSQVRYIPVLEDLVIGVIKARRGKDEYEVDINSHSSASLPITAFSGATRKNMDSLRPGTLLYARVTFANRHMDPIISCMDASEKASVFGLLDDGYVFSCPSALCRRLLRPQCYPLEVLNSLLPFEIAVGFNNWIWVKSAESQDVFFLRDAILSIPLIDPDQLETSFRSMREKMKTQGDP